ncbi:acylneuraminate cytidylyltransferase [Salipaludibacillus neizhouensis]|uniref:Acylneuraminate cytidylyltransferase n=1 Tax=Salipaludibacillus neizhouensis TaxID=885475 RepID=A0A3A9KEE6_9BACI|nr:acylneuraminate cytidylyltransferase family protein [Salipaludibacillus neizhouensis]RKL69100.1 acylneuraminate cytidylyltransferase [Salipaludibacillus neizhouensis]
MILGIIPARGGSKRLPNKNVSSLNGKPLIEYSILTANNSTHINRVVVSTENKEIAHISRNAGADIPFLRPSELAEDNSNVIDTCLHLLKELKQSELYVPDIIILLQPTSPLRSSDHIDEAIELLLKEKADTVLSVSPLEYALNTLMKVNTSGCMTPYLANNSFNKTDQIYRLNGAIYVVRVQTIIENKSFSSSHSIPYIMPLDKSVDIDTAFDFQLVSFLMKKEQND